MYLPTTAFQIIRKERHLTERIGRRIVREKRNAAGKGVEIDGDVFGLLCEDLSSRLANYMHEVGEMTRNFGSTEYFRRHAEAERG